LYFSKKEMIGGGKSGSTNPPTAIPTIPGTISPSQNKGVPHSGQKVVGHGPIFGSWTHERFVRTVDLDLLSLVICSYTKHGACATLTFVAVADNYANWVTGHFGA
jgi:hypothetical protein